MLAETSLVAERIESDTYAFNYWSDPDRRIVNTERARREWMRVWGQRMRFALYNSPVHAPTHGAR